MSPLARQDVSPLAEQLDGSRRYAYADPPYPGLASYYKDHPDYAGEVDHAVLVRRLTAEYDGWALSTNSRSLHDVLAVCPADVAVAAWFRGPRPGLAYRPLEAWEPVVYRGERHMLSTWSTRRIDALVYVARPRLTDRFRVIGSKPAEFCGWLFTLLGLQLGDVLDDVFPGSGRVSQAWQTYCVDLRRDPARQVSLL